MAIDFSLLPDQSGKPPTATGGIDLSRLPDKSDSLTRKLVDKQNLRLGAPVPLGTPFAPPQLEAEAFQRAVSPSEPGADLPARPEEDPLNFRRPVRELDLPVQPVPGPITEALVFVPQLATAPFKAASKFIGKKRAQKRAATRIAEAAELPKQPELLEAFPKLTVSPQKAPLMEEKGLANLPTLKELQAQVGFPTTTPSAPKVEAFVKGTMGGGINPNTGKPLDKVNIFGVRGDKAELKKLFGDEAPGSVPEALLREKGIPLPGEAPIAPRGPAFGDIVPEAVPPKSVLKFGPEDVRDINKKAGLALPVPEEQLGLGIKAAKGKVTKPIEIPTPDGLPTGGTERLAEVAALKEVKDISPTQIFAQKQDRDIAAGAEKVFRAQTQTGMQHEVNAAKATNEQMASLAKEFPYKSGSSESKLLQMYGESPNKAESAKILTEELGEEVAGKIIQSEKFLRQQYNDLLTNVNRVRSANGEQAIPFREDYFNHWNELNFIDEIGLGRFFGGEEATTIAKSAQAAAESAKQRAWWHPSEIAFKHLRRGERKFKEDAVEGFRRYSTDAQFKIQMQPVVNEYRQTAELLKDSAPNLSKSYLDLADHLAGKLDVIDAAAIEKFGPEAVKIFLELSGRGKSNLIVGNPSVMFSQLLSSPNVVGDIGVKSTLGSMWKMVSDPTFRAFMLENSPTMQNRLQTGISRNASSGVIRKAMQKPIQFIDSHVVMYSWAGKFLEQMKAGVGPDEAAKVAEQFAALTQSGLTKVSSAPLLRSKIVQSTAPFMNIAGAASRFTLFRLLEGKTFGGKLATGTRFAAAVGALMTAGHLLFNRDKITAKNLPVPGAPVLTRGIGGVPVSTAGRLIGSVGKGNTIEEAFMAAMLFQNRIPGGFTVGKAAINLFKSPQKK